MVTTGDRREHLADTKCQPDAQQAKRACIAIILTIKTRIYLYITKSPNLIEEAARHRKQIFDMWESFGYGSTKFLAQAKMSTHHGIMTSSSPFYN